jgi:DNA-binding Lrp family transcriptional regulator
VGVLQGIREVLEVHGMAGEADLMLRVAARDIDNLFRIGQEAHALPDGPATSLNTGKDHCSKLTLSGEFCERHFVYRCWA